MRQWCARSAILLLMLTAGAVRTASAQTCIVIDEQHDMLGRDERTAARLLVSKQFELAGRRIVDRDCAETYTVSHIRLGSMITVTLSGPAGKREATAIGLDDLPAVYSQMVRSITTGQPMGMAVVDRTNVSATQDLPPRRVHTEGYWHARVGFGSLFGESTHNGASFGFGYRTQFDRLGLDVSFLNAQLNNGTGYYGANSSAWTLIKLQGLYFTNPTGNRSAYVGGGLGYGHMMLDDSAGGGYSTSGHGSGLQGSLTGGYEIARATSARVFIQADATLPFYNLHFQRYSYPEPPVNGRYSPPVVTMERRYVPSLTISVGFGWHRRPR